MKKKLQTKKPQLKLHSCFQAYQYLTCSINSIIGEYRKTESVLTKKAIKKRTEEGGYYCPIPKELEVRHTKFMLLNLLAYKQTYHLSDQNCPKHPKASQSVPKCTKMYQSIPKDTKAFQSIPKIIKIWISGDGFLIL